jgi:hypothetical protein
MGPVFVRCPPGNPRPQIPDHRRLASPRHHPVAVSLLFNGSGHEAPLNGSGHEAPRDRVCALESLSPRNRLSNGGGWRRLLAYGRSDDCTGRLYSILQQYTSERHTVWPGRIRRTDVMARLQNHELMTAHRLRGVCRARAPLRYGLAFWPLGNSCNSGGKVSIHELTEGVEPSHNRRHHHVDLQGILQVCPHDPFPELVE